MPPPRSPEFRRRAVELARTGDKSVCALAKSLGISQSCLSNWIRQAAIEEGDLDGLRARPHNRLPDQGTHDPEQPRHATAARPRQTDRHAGTTDGYGRHTAGRGSRPPDRPPRHATTRRARWGAGTGARRSATGCQARQSATVDGRATDRGRLRGGLTAVRHCAPSMAGSRRPCTQSQHDRGSLPERDSWQADVAGGLRQARGDLRVGLMAGGHGGWGVLCLAVGQVPAGGSALLVVD